MKRPRKMLLKLKQRADTKSADAQKRLCFQKTIRAVQEMLNLAELISDKAEILEYSIDVIGRELAYSVSAELLHFGSTPKNREYVIPLGHITKTARSTCVLENINIVSDTYDLDKLRKAIPQVFRRGFRQELSYYTGTYYPAINLVVVENGRHHLSAAYVKNTGSAEVQICDLQKAFPLLKTDGAYWYFTDISPRAVYDYRVAVLFELARIKHNLLGDFEFKSQRQSQSHADNVEQLAQTGLEDVCNRLLKSQSNLRFELQTQQEEARFWKQQSLAKDQRIFELEQQLSSSK